MIIKYASGERQLARLQDCCKCGGKGKGGKGRWENHIL